MDLFESDVGSHFNGVDFKKSFAEKTNVSKLRCNFSDPRFQAIWYQFVFLELFDEFFTKQRAQNQFQPHSRNKFRPINRGSQPRTSAKGVSRTFRNNPSAFA